MTDADHVRSNVSDREAYRTLGDSIYQLGNVSGPPRDAMEARFKHVQGPAPAPVRQAVSRVVGEASARPASPSINRVSRLPARAPSPGPPPLPEKQALFSPVKGATEGARALGPPKFGLRGPASAARPAPSLFSAPDRPSSSGSTHSRDGSTTVIPNRFGAPTGRTSIPSGVPAPSSQSARRSLNAEEPSSDDVERLIRSVLTNDPNLSVDGLKRIQKMLETNARAFFGHEEDLMRAVIKQTQLVFTPSHQLADAKWFRLAKHLIQTLNNFCLHPRLLRNLDDTIMKELLAEMTLRLLETDDSPGSRSFALLPRSFMSFSLVQDC